MEYVASWDRDMVRSATKRGLEHGMAKGIAAGLVKKAKEMAARMLDDGQPIETIAKYTGLSAAEIKKMAPKSH